MVRSDNFKCNGRPCILRIASLYGEDIWNFSLHETDGVHLLDSAYMSASTNLTRERALIIKNLPSSLLTNTSDLSSNKKFSDWFKRLPENFFPSFTFPSEKFVSATIPVALKNQKKRKSVDKRIDNAKRLRR